MAERVLLINASSDKDPIKPPHLGLTYLDAFLTQQGIETDIFDSRFENESLFDRIKQFSPSIAGFTTVTADLGKILSESSMIAQVYPDIQLVYGGIHATVRPQDLLRSDQGVVISGEGENTFYSLIQQKALGRKGWSQIPGLRFLENGRLVSTGNAALIPNVDTLPIPLLGRYLDDSRVNQFQIMTSRGCPYGCDFCSSEKIWERKLRRHSSSRVVEEVERFAEHDITRFIFVDDTLTVDPNRLEEICTGIKRIGKPLNWTANSRVDFAPHADRRKMLRQMREAGCFLICYGVESGSQQVLDRIHKGITVDKAIEAIRMTQEEGLSAKANLIVGLPGSFEDQLQIINFVRKAEPDYLSLHYIMPLPGTRLLTEAARFGLQLDEDSAVANFHSDVEKPTMVNYQHPDYVLNSDQIIEAMGICVRAIEGLGYTSDPKPGQKKIMKSPLDAEIKPKTERPNYYTLLS